MILTGLHLALTPVGGGNLEPKIMEVKLYQYPRGFNKGGLLQGDICPTISKSSWENNCLLIESSMNELIEKFNPEFVIGSTQRNAFVGSSDNYSPCISMWDGRRTNTYGWKSIPHSQTNSPRMFSFDGRERGKYR